MRFDKDPFTANVETDFASKANELVMYLNEASLQLELIDIQSSEYMQQSLQLARFEKFRSHEVST